MGQCLWDTHTHSVGRTHPSCNKRSREGHKVWAPHWPSALAEKEKCARCHAPKHREMVTRRPFLKGAERERATYRGKQTLLRSCPGSDPCKTRAEWARALAGRWTELLHVPSHAGTCRGSQSGAVPRRPPWLGSMRSRGPGPTRSPHRCCASHRRPRGPGPHPSWNQHR